MKSARFFIVVFLFSIFVASFFANKVFAGIGQVDPPETSQLTGPGTYLDPTPVYQTIAKYGTYMPNSTKTSASVLNAMLTELILQLDGTPKITLANGKEVGGSGGAIGFLSNQIAFMTTTPVISGGDFVAYNFQKLTVPGVKPTYAAEGGIGGVGYRSLFPVLQLWTLMRNVAYLFFAIIFVVVGMLIILGKKLDAKNAIAIQTALPKIVISLILVTFSYAIAGFVIDIMYVVITIIFSVLGTLLDDSASPIGGGRQGLLDGIKNGEIIFIYFFRTPWLAAAKGVTEATQELAKQIVGGGSFGVIDGVVKNVIGDVAGGAVSILVNLILVIAVFYALFKIWLKLIMTYIQIILAVIVGPFIIMMDAIPKPNKSYFMDWLKGLLGNAMIYPVTIAMILVGMLISAGVGNSGGIGDGSFIAPLTGIGNVGVAQVIIGLGMLLSIPAILEKVPGWFGAGGKGGLAELGNAWAPVMAGAAGFTANNALSKRLGRDRAEYNAAEEDWKKKKRAKQIAKKLAVKYGSDEIAAPQIDPANLERAENFKESLRGIAPNSPLFGKVIKPDGTFGTDDIHTSEEWLKQFGTANGEQKKEMMRVLRGLGNVSDLSALDYLYISAVSDERAYTKAMGEFYTKMTNQGLYEASEIGKIREKAISAATYVGSNPVLGRASNIFGYFAKPMEWLSKAGGGK